MQSICWIFKDIFEYFYNTAHVKFYVKWKNKKNNRNIELKPEL